MTATVIVYLLTYAALLVFAVAIAVRIVRYLTAPLHVRWELYPVPHEKGRAHNGGSRLEEIDWWTKPQKWSLVGELKGMLPEMLLIKSLWENNRSLWYRSFPFHFGLYLLAGLLALLIVGSAVEMSGTSVAPSADCVAAGVLHYLTIAFGAAGLVLATLGCLALLHRRLTDEDLKDFTSGAAIFNLVFILGVLLVSGLACVLADGSFALARGYVRNVLTLNVAPIGSALVAWELVAASLLLGYIPLTYMSHFFMKYFTYHHVRWDDKPLLSTGKIEAQMSKALEYPVSWSAPHIKGDGRKTWGEMAMETGEE